MAGPSDVDQGAHAPRTPWDDQDWRRAAFAWTEAELARHGLAVAGPSRVRLRPWSVVIRVPTGAGPTVWFKANPPGSAFEPALMAALHRWVPEAVLAPLAVDTTRAWSLLPDGGPLLSDRPGGADLTTALRRYGNLQRDLTGRVADLLALGVPDLRPETLPAVLDRMLVDLDRPDLVPLGERVRRWCAELAAGPVPASLDHQDLHGHQMFDAPDGRYRFFDWGDASVAHPFASLLVPAREVAAHGGRAIADNLRDAYLDAWRDRHPDPAYLTRLVSLATRVAVVGRAASWTRVFPGNLDGPVARAQAAAWLSRLAGQPPL